MTTCSIHKLNNNLIEEIAFLILKLSNLCKYSDIVKLTFNSLYKSMINTNSCLFSNYLYKCLVGVLIIGKNTSVFTDSGYIQT